MDTTELLNRRLTNNGLRTAPFKNAAQAVAHLGAVQAQDFAAAGLFGLLVTIIAMRSRPYRLLAARYAK